MKKLLILGTLALAGCAGMPGATVSPSTSPGILSPLVSSGVITENTRTKARQVQAETSRFCQYIPTVGTILSLFSAGVAGTAAAIGASVCNVVTTAPLADGGRRLAVMNGVVIKGRFVK